MLSKLTYRELIVKILKDAKKPLGVGEIWQKALETGLDEKLSSIGKTPKQTIYREFVVNKIDFMQITHRPSTFWLKARQNELSKQKEPLILKVNHNKETRREKIKFSERGLNPALVRFLHDEFKLERKTIYYENKKSESGKDKWNYPDIVGVYFPYKTYNNQTFTLLNNLKLNNYKIFSFKVKININFSNLKECYFQAVSNSNWANEGYLVVLEELDSEVLSELRRLNQSFGIGVIQLNGSEISNSKIVLSAKERDLDMQTIDMLVRQNKDFEAFIKDINNQIEMSSKGKV